MYENYSIKHTIKSLESVAADIKKQNKYLKELREQRKRYELEIAEWMERHDYQEYEGLKLSKLKPKKIVRKKQKEKKDDAIKLFEDIGIIDPERLWHALQKTQKNTPSSSEGNDVHLL
jgi:hypothetical protein